MKSSNERHTDQCAVCTTTVNSISLAVVSAALQLTAGVSGRSRYATAREDVHRGKHPSLPDVGFVRHTDSQGPSRASDSAG